MKNRFLRFGYLFFMALLISEAFLFAVAGSSLVLPVAGATLQSTTTPIEVESIWLRLLKEAPLTAVLFYVLIRQERKIGDLAKAIEENTGEVHVFASKIDSFASKIDQANADRFEKLIDTIMEMGSDRK